MTTHIVLLAHGSRDPRHARDVTRIRDRVAARLDLPVWASYLELCGPQPADLPLPPGASVAVLPLLLADGYHLGNDVPAAAATLVDTGHAVDVLPAPLMATSRWPLRLLEGVRTPPGTSILVVTAGSSDPRVAAAWEMAARRWSAVPGRSGHPREVRVAHATGPGERPETVARRAEHDGAPVATVVPALVADGYFADRARASADAAGCGVTDVVGASEVFTAQLAATILPYLAAASARPSLGSRRQRAQPSVAPHVASLRTPA
jgi:sirohydrochlorin ferrochelatase